MIKGKPNIKNILTTQIKSGQSGYPKGRPSLAASGETRRLPPHLDANLAEDGGHVSLRGGLVAAKLKE